MNEEDEMHNNPNNWKMGIFYFNPKDKRIFVPKRIEVWGITFNFGNPIAILAFGILVIFIIFISKN